MLFFFGLGNPGDSYKNTYHNIGFICIDKILEEFKNRNIKIEFISKLKSEIYKIVYQEETFFFVKPQSYMNLSGPVLKCFKDHYNMENNFYVFHDDFSLNLGYIKIKSKGSSAGHNGIQSIINIFGEEFNRIRVGIADQVSSKAGINWKNFVLSSFEKKNEPILNLVWLKIVEIFFFIINNKENTMPKLMNQFNGKHVI